MLYFNLILEPAAKYFNRLLQSVYGYLPYLHKIFILIIAFLPTQSISQTTTQIEITGIRLTWGNAVNCPILRADDGSDHPISYLPPDIPLGSQLAVHGSYGVKGTCHGTVLIPEKIEIIQK